MPDELSFWIRARDATRAGFQSALGGLRRLAGRVAAVARRMATSMVRATQRIVVGLAAFGTWAVKTASDVAEMRSKFSVVFGSLAREVEQWAATHARAVRRSKTDLMEYLAGVQDLVVPMGLTRKEAAELSKAIVKMGIDVASFQNKSDPDVIMAMSKALLGERESLKLLGIAFSEEDVKRKAKDMGLAKSTKNVTRHAKALATLKLMQENSTDATGDAIRTRNQFANVMRGVRSAFKDFRIEMGQQLIVGLGLAKTFGGLIDKIKEWTKTLKETKAVEQWASKAKKALGPLAETIKGLFGDEAERNISIEKFKKVGMTFADQAVAILKAKAPVIGEEIAKGILKGLIKKPFTLGEQFTKRAERTKAVTAGYYSMLPREKRAEARERKQELEALNEINESIKNLKLD